MELITRLKIVGERPFFSTGPMELFERIEQTGSIRQATEQMGMSYTKALRIIKRANKELGFDFVVSEKGGAGRGSTKLTDEGKQYLLKFKRFYEDVSSYADKLFYERFGTHA